MNSRIFSISICASLLLGFLVVQPVVAQDQMNTEIRKKIKEYQALKTLTEKEAMYRSLKEKFSEEEVQSISDYLMADLAASSLREENFEKYKNYKHQIDEPDLLYYMVSEVLVSWAEEGKNLEMAAKIGRTYLKDLSEAKEVEANGYNNYVYTTFLQSYAVTQQKLGNVDSAIKHMAEADAMIEHKSPDFINKYASILSADGQHQRALDMLIKTAENGSYTLETMKVMKTAYAEVHGSSDGFAKYEASIEDSAYKKAYKKVIEKRVEEPRSAPKFTLTDLDGESVSLEEFKGKIVVVDFWATWCSPCKASFPGMQLAVDAYANDPEVKFLFVDVGEERNVVQDYMDDSSYRFHVVLDQDRSVMNNYGMPGIPTKFVIDKDGNIQFKSVGYSGSDAAVFNNMKAMIERVRERAYE